MRSGFFDNTEVYSEDFARFAKGLLTNGVLADTDDALKVSAGTGMQVSIAPGYCWINGHFGVAETAETLTIPAADGSLGRIDRIVARLDLSAPSVSLQVLQGTPSASPEAPAPARAGNYYDLGLATVSVPAGTLAITESLITDTRNDNDVCGAVIYRNAEAKALESKANKSDIPNYSFPLCRDLAVVYADEIAKFGGDAYAWIQHRIQTNNVNDIFIGDTLPAFNVEYDGDTYTYTPRVWRIGKQTDYKPSQTSYIDFICDELWFYRITYQAGDGWNNGIYAPNNTYGSIYINYSWLCSLARAYLNGAQGYYISNGGVYFTGDLSTPSPIYNVYGMFPNSLKNVIIDKSKYLSERLPTTAGTDTAKAGTSPKTTDSHQYLVQNVGKLWLPNEVEYFGVQKLGTELAGTSVIDKNTLTARFPQFRSKHFPKKFLDLYTSSYATSRMIYTILETPKEGSASQNVAIQASDRSFNPVYSEEPVSIINGAGNNYPNQYPMICFTIA